MDRRTTPFSGRRALVSLRGTLDADFTEGEAASVACSVTDLLAKPQGARDRQLVLGDAVTVIDRDGAHVFVQSAKDGYCGWLLASAIGPPIVPTHWVAARASHLYASARVQAPDTAALPHGARLAVIATDGAFAQTAQGFVPLAHLRAMDDRPDDPVTVATGFVGAPYLWGGNTAAGIDCSGLVQAALLACGHPCPGDSDQQQSLGQALEAGTPLRRGDLVFWKGHVAWVVDEATILHANGHSMTVAFEPTSAAIQRIEHSGGGPVTARRRLTAV